MNHGSLFSGIGGFDLAAEWMGWTNKFHCEWNPFGQKVLKHYWPEAESYEDITKTDFTKWRGTIDILTGGFPCQPFSVAGKRQGENDDRYLWPEMLRCIREIKPAFVVAENVSGLVTMENGKTLEGVWSDLENEGYTVEPCLIEASSVGAWHRRERIWILAYSCNSSNISNKRQEREKEEIQGECKKIRQSRQSFRTSNTFHSDYISKRNVRSWEKEIQELRGIQRCEDFGRSAILGGRPDISTPVLCRSYDGISDGVDRVKALGNAIVPQVAYQIFKAIEEFNMNEQIKIVEDIISERFDLESGALREKTRKMEIVEPRNLCIYILINHIGIDIKTVCRYFNLTHPSIYRQMIKTEQKVKFNCEYKEIINQFK